jgi:[ribosomal protein S18]-alanine N-acetyltransferase
MIRVRAAKHEDLQRIVEIASRSATAASWNITAYRTLLAAAASARQIVLVILEDDHVMGFLAGRQVAHDEWEIENVLMSGSARRRGLGSRLLGEFFNLVRERKGSNVFLEVRESNHAARALYEKWAFVEAGRRKNYYQDPAEDALVLRFSFPGPD